MVRLLGMLIVLGVLLVACGGDGDDDQERILQLGGGNLTESELRATLQEADFSDPDIAAVCDLLDRLGPNEAADFIMNLPPSEDVAWLQNAPGDDRIRALTILDEECPS